MTTMTIGTDAGLAVLDWPELPDGVRDAFLEYFENAATAMMNRGGPPF